MCTAIKLRSLRNQLHQLPIPIDHVILDLVGCDFGEELAGVIRSCFLQFFASPCWTGHGALGFGDKVDVLNLALLERNGPVWVVVANRSGYLRKSLWAYWASCSHPVDFSKRAQPKSGLWALPFCARNILGVN